MNLKLSMEEGYELTKNYVRYFWRVKKFYSLERDYDLEDIVHELFATFLRRGLFDKYNASISSKKYHVMNAVRNGMIDLLRKQKEQYYLDQPDDEGIPLMEKMESSEDLQGEVIAEDYRNELIEHLPEETGSEVEGFSPVLGHCRMSLRVVAIHLEMGYKPKEISLFFINPRSDREVSVGRIYQLIKEIRCIMQEQLDRDNLKGHI